MSYMYCASSCPEYRVNASASSAGHKVVLGQAEEGWEAEPLSEPPKLCCPSKGSSSSFLGFSHTLIQRRLEHYFSFCELKGFLLCLKGRLDQLPGWGLEACNFRPAPPGFRGRVCGAVAVWFPKAFSLHSLPAPISCFHPHLLSAMR